MLFPKIFILSTINFSVSSILKVRLILLSVIFSITLTFVDSYCSLNEILSISLIIFSTEFIEYGSFFKSEKTFLKFSKFLLSKSFGNSSSRLLKKNFSFASILNISSKLSSSTNFANDELNYYIIISFVKIKIS